ncbi:MAG: DNA polymerase II [Thermoplasmata archaeon]|nr:DNA polymerase II [Thermoplasmata archaeon]
MDTVDLFLLSGSYRSVDGGVVVELYGRTRTGETLVARYYGFEPYFMVTEPTAEARERLKADPQVKRIDDIQIWVAGSARPAARVTVTNPWTVPEYRERYRKAGDDNSVLACDIPFVHRFLYDKGLGLTLRFEAEDEASEVRQLYGVTRVVRVVTTEGHEIRPSEPFRPPLTVLSFDIENAIRERTIFTICGVVARANGERSTFRFGDDDERTILQRFVEVVLAEDPDVITGYNIGGYDFPLLIERAAVLKLKELGLGRDRSAPRDLGQRLWRLSGRIIADAWWSARRELHPKQETLQFVSRLLLGEGKLDVDRRRIEQEWAKDRERVMEYCEHDADLALRIVQKLRTVEKAADMATVAHLPLEDGLNGRTSLFIDAMLVPRADREGVGVPPTHRTGRDAPIEGGYVHAIRPGLSNWVVVLDFKSMYPSIIIARNICFTTLSPTGTTVAPGGARFVTADVRRGLIPGILTELLADRDRFRQLANNGPDVELRPYYDGLQYAVKLLMNSFYGVMASSFYRFTNKDIGAAITAFARDAITTIIRELETEGSEVVYSDTDSVFVRSPEPSLEGARKFGEELSRRFTHEGVTFEFQSVYEALFSHGAKKRYVGRTAWPKVELVVRGYESRRTDAFDYQSEALNDVFERVLRGDIEGAIAQARELVQRCRRGDVPPERLVVARSVRAEEEYNESTREALPFLRVFKQLQAEGYDVIPGMKVAWIVTDARHTPQEIEPWVEGRPLAKPPDYGYYAERVAQTLARVTEVYDWDAAALLGGKTQRKLDDSEPPTPSARAPPPATLDTPISELAKPGRRRPSTLSEFG